MVATMLHSMAVRALLVILAAGVLFASIPTDVAYAGGPDRSPITKQGGGGISPAGDDDG